MWGGVASMLLDLEYSLITSKLKEGAADSKRKISKEPNELI